jgi:hypothetical protein
MIMLICISCVCGWVHFCDSAGQLIIVGRVAELKVESFEKIVEPLFKVLNVLGLICNIIIGIVIGLVSYLKA